jgi:hypothetical protein
LTPLLPGHGIQRGYGCEKNNVCVKGGYNPSFMPKSRDGYIQFTDWSIKMLNQEMSLITRNKDENFVIGAIGSKKLKKGLSAGAVMAGFASTRPNNPITRIIAGI